eukprot:13793376-Ditylum_brightwellii.AAC.1
MADTNGDGVAVVCGKHNLLLDARIPYSTRLDGGLYQMALSLNALILIVFGWNQEKFAEKVEKPLHTTIITVALTTALVPLAYQSYNPSC